MPQKEKKLDVKKLEYYKKLLLKTRDQLLGDLNQINSESDMNSDKGDVTGHAMHMADVATDMYDREFNLGLASNDRETLLKIEAALKRIEKETYGFCLESGKKIPEARLKALPWAEYCLEVQEKIDAQMER